MADDPQGGAPPRRDFLNVAVGGTAAVLGFAATYPVARFLEPASQAGRHSVEVGKEDDFPKGSSRAVQFGERAALLIRLPDGAYRAYVALCTHLQCVVGYSAERNRIECQCHGGAYSIDGVNVAGPPPRPLKRLQVAVTDGVIVVSEA